MPTDRVLKHITIMEHCSSVWSPYTKVSAIKIEKIKCRATKMAENLKDVSYSE